MRKENEKGDDAVAGRMGLQVPPRGFQDRKSQRVSNRVNTIRTDISDSSEEEEEEAPYKNRPVPNRPLNFGKAKEMVVIEELTVRKDDDRKSLRVSNRVNKIRADISSSEEEN